MVLLLLSSCLWSPPADAASGAGLRWRRHNPIAGLPTEAVIAGHNGDDSLAVCRLVADSGERHAGWVMIRDDRRRCYASDGRETFVREDTFEVLVHHAAPTTTTPPADRTRWGRGAAVEVSGVSLCRCGEDNLDLWVGQRRGGSCEGADARLAPRSEAANDCDALLAPSL